MHLRDRLCRRSAYVAVVLLTTPLVAFGINVGATSSSVLVDERSNPPTYWLYEPVRAVDGSSLTGWVEGVPGPGINEWVQIDPGAWITEIEVEPGFFDPRWWEANNRVRTAELEIRYRCRDDRHSGGRADCTESGRRTIDVEFEDVMEAQPIRLPTRYLATSVRLTIKAVYPGARWDDTVVSEIRFSDEEIQKELVPSGGPFARWGGVHQIDPFQFPGASRVAEDYAQGTDMVLRYHVHSYHESHWFRWMPGATQGASHGFVNDLIVDLHFSVVDGAFPDSGIVVLTAFDDGLLGGVDAQGLWALDRQRGTIDLDLIWQDPQHARFSNRASIHLVAADRLLFRPDSTSTAIHAVNRDSPAPDLPIERQQLMRLEVLGADQVESRPRTQRMPPLHMIGDR